MEYIPIDEMVRQLRHILSQIKQDRNKKPSDKKKAIRHTMGESEKKLYNSSGYYFKALW